MNPMTNPTSGEQWRDITGTEEVLRVGDECKQKGSDDSTFRPVRFSIGLKTSTFPTLQFRRPITSRIEEKKECEHDFGNTLAPVLYCKKCEQTELSVLQSKPSSTKQRLEQVEKEREMFKLQLANLLDLMGTLETFYKRREMWEALNVSQKIKSVREGVGIGKWDNEVSKLYNRAVDADSRILTLEKELAEARKALESAISLDAHIANFIRWASAENYNLKTLKDHQMELRKMRLNAARLLAGITAQSALKGG